MADRHDSTCAPAAEAAQVLNTAVGRRALFAGALTIPLIAAAPLASAADKAYDADDRVITPLTKSGKRVVIPPKSNRRCLRDFDREIYKARHLIENFFCRLKEFRAIATRYDKTARNYLAGVHLAAIIIWLN